jgi:hypothetical protein
MTQLHVVSAVCKGNQVIINGYIDGVIQLGTTFRNAVQILEQNNGQTVKLATPVNPRTVELKVVKIIVYDREITEFSGSSGTTVLEGSGASAIQWGDLLSEE